MSPLVPVYRRRASALHAARAGASASYCCALALVAVLYDNPLVLAGALAAILAAGAAAGVGRELRRAAAFALGLALLVALINPLVSSEGLTVLWRGGAFLGRRWDITLEALVYGAVAGLRVVVLVLAFGLFSAVVDPDELLRLLRRISYRGALTAALATRLVPVLARDGARMGEAARCRPAPPGRMEVVRSTLAGSLERAVDLAAALEVRGYAGARRPARVPRRWSRHDLRVAGAAASIACLAVWAKLAGAGHFRPYPTTWVAAGAAELALIAGLVLLALAPFAGIGGRLGVARA
jgi:energy-coupling factor transport system permease protein